MSLLVPDSGLLFWMVFIFGIVVFVLARFGFPVILKMVDERKAFIEDSLLMAEKARTELEKVKADSEVIIDNARKEHLRIINESNLLKEQLVKEAKVKAEQEAAKVIEEARVKIVSEKDAAMREIRREVAALSVDIAEKVLKSKLASGDEQEEMINKLLDEITISKS
ncbi:MAG: synthase subcomplex subunit [Bacteroidetes bacterium]|nr:synthase subcomplex subunit [Bacteroidota bacterium]